MTLETRAYTAADRDAVARLWHEAWSASGLATTGDPTFDDYCARLDGEGRDWLIRIASLRATIGGFAAFDLAEGRLRQLFVAPGCQRLGVGTRLFEEARRAMPNGFWLRTDLANQAARRFYQAHGLTLVGESRHPDRGHPIATYRWP